MRAFERLLGVFGHAALQDRGAAARLPTKAGRAASRDSRVARRPRPLGLRGARPGERGAALVVVTFVLIVVLAGGLAAVALTTGELASSRGHRTRALVEACTQAALAKVRAALPAVTAGAVKGTVRGGLSFRVGHYGTTPGDLDNPLVELDSSLVDMTSLYEGQNATNTMGSTQTLKLYSVTVVCEGVAAGVGEREVQLVFRYGVPTGG